MKRITDKARIEFYDDSVYEFHIGDEGEDTLIYYNEAGELDLAFGRGFRNSVDAAIRAGRKVRP